MGLHDDIEHNVVIIETGNGNQRKLMFNMNAREPDILGSICCYFLLRRGYDM